MSGRNCLSSCLLPDGDPPPCFTSKARRVFFVHFHMHTTRTLHVTRTAAHRGWFTRAPATTRRGVQGRFVQQLQAQKLLDDGTFPAVVHICFDLLICYDAQVACLPQAWLPSNPLRLVDRFALLLGCICARSDAPAAVVRTACAAARAVIADVTHRRKSALRPKPLHRALLGLLHELPLATDAVPWPQGLGLFAQVLHEAQPTKVPGFAFAWLELLAHRKFMVPLLEARPPPHLSRCMSCRVPPPLPPAPPRRHRRTRPKGGLSRLALLQVLFPPVPSFPLEATN